MASVIIADEFNRDLFRYEVVFWFGGANISDSFLRFLCGGGGGRSFGKRSYISQKSVVVLKSWFYPQHLVAVGIF